jgi:hypothetical protein
MPLLPYLAIPRNENLYIDTACSDDSTNNTADFSIILYKTAYFVINNNCSSNHRFIGQYNQRNKQTRQKQIKQTDTYRYKQKIYCNPQQIFKPLKVWK